MTPERWEEVGRVFQAAILVRPEERSAYLHKACNGDEDLLNEVQSLLELEAPAGDFLGDGAMKDAARMLADEKPPSPVGKKLGQYEVLSLIGSGGMGDIYKARHVTLNSYVALKFLPPFVGQDTDRLRRFKLEARAASALNHPNIVIIHDFAEVDDWRFIVTEYVAGETLRERLKRGMEVNEALDVAIQIASGVAAAHEVGVIHRDIKPENIMIRGDGYVKVLDFGLAKLSEEEMVKSFYASSTLDRTKTDTGVMGTAGYMSPEQARGQSVDHRTDIFSLGVVIYEMVTRQRPFASGSDVDVIMPTPEQEPSLLIHSPKVPVELQVIVNKALRSNKGERYQTVAELLTDLKSARSKLTAKSRISAKRLSLLAATLVLMMAAIWLYATRQPARSLLPPMKVVPFTSFAGSEWLGAFSPDGNQIAFAWTGQEGNSLADIYVKQIGLENPKRLTTSHNGHALSPVWTPDGKDVAFVRYSETGAATIFVVPASGGAERKLIDLGSHVPFAPVWDWSPDGKAIAFAQRDSKDGPTRIFLVSADTLARRALTSPPDDNLADLNPTGDSDPVFSPDGQSVAFVRKSSWVSADIYIVPVDGGEPRRLTFNNTTIAGLTWTADGREIIFSQNPVFVEGNGNLWRIPASGGTAERFAEGGYNAIYPHIARRRDRLAFVQGSGDLSIYRKKLSATSSSKSSPTKFVASTRNDTSPEYSPDGRKVVFTSDRSGKFEIWKCDSDGANAVQLTFLNEFAGSPRWSPDGQQIAFDLFGENRGQVYVVSAERSQPRPVTSGDFDNIGPSWSRNGRWIYFASNRTGVYQVWRVPAEGGEAVQVTRQGGYVPLESPDGEFIYYVKTFPTPGIWRIPVNGGDESQITDSFRSEFKTDWAVVEDGIYFINIHTKPGIAIEFFDFATSKVRRIANLGKLPHHSHNITVSPDRREILYSQLDNVGEDIMLVENFR